MGACGHRVGRGGRIARWMRSLWTDGSVKVVATTEQESREMLQYLGELPRPVPGPLNEASVRPSNTLTLSLSYYKHFVVVLVGPED